MWSQTHGHHSTSVSLIYIHIKDFIVSLCSSCLSSTLDLFLFPFSILSYSQSWTPVFNLPLIPLFLWPAVPVFLMFAPGVSLFLSVFAGVCAFLHVSVWWTGMTQWCWNERSRAWAFLSKRTIKPYAVHNELTLIQLRCTSCPPVFSLFLFPSVLWNSFSFRHAQDIHTRCISRRCHPKWKDLLRVGDHKFWLSLSLHGIIS